MKKEIGTLNNLMIVIWVLFIGIVFSWAFTTTIETHKENMDWIRNHHKQVIVEKIVYVPVIVYDYSHKAYEYTYCDFRESLHNPCQTFTTDVELNEFDTGASWLRLKEGVSKPEVSFTTNASEETEGKMYVDKEMIEKAKWWYNEGKGREYK